jgi:hypothetical protein
MAIALHDYVLLVFPVIPDLDRILRRSLLALKAKTLEIFVRCGITDTASNSLLRTILSESVRV